MFVVNIADEVIIKLMIFRVPELGVGSDLSREGSERETSSATLLNSHPILLYQMP